MRETVHCRECRGVGRVWSGDGYVVCLSCRGTGIIDVEVTQEQLDERARKAARYLEERQVRDEAESRKYRRWDRLFIWGIVGFFALVGGLVGGLLGLFAGAGIGLIVVVWIWVAG
jgi:F0F1-type ATP synthase beta subunit